MDEDQLVQGLVNSLAFEVEAIPADNVIKFTSTNGTPLNVKVRVRNKDEPRLVQRGIVSVPKLGNHIASLDKIRLISSEQTILSFNVYMETELEKTSQPKNHKRGLKFFKFGGCLGTSYDEDEGPYLPGSSNKNALRSKTSSKSESDIHGENKDVAEKLKLKLETSNAVTRNQRKLFGKCKPGGCLDPPFGEDKEPYGLPKTNPEIKLKQTVNKVEDSKSTRVSSSGPGKLPKASKSPTTLVQNESDKDVVEPMPLLDIYARSGSVDRSPTSNYSNAVITDSPKMPSSKSLNRDSDVGKKINKTCNDDSLRQSYQYPETYFIPPKDILQHKEEERRYSRERSNDQIRGVNDNFNRGQIKQDYDKSQRSVPYIFDASNKNIRENVNEKIPGQSTKLSKHKGKDNTERIKQTLTDLTSNDIENLQKAPEGYRKTSKPHLNVPLVTKHENITKSFPVYKETPSHIVTDSEYANNGDMQNKQDDADSSFIPKSNLSERKEKDQQRTVPPSKDQEAAQISLREKPIIEKIDETLKKKLSKDIRNKNVLRNGDHEENKELIQFPGNSEAVMIERPEPEKLKDLYISPILANDQNAVKSQQSVPSFDTPISSQVSYLPSNLDSNLEYKPLTTRDKTNKSTESKLQSNTNTVKDKTKLLLKTRLQSLENLTDVNDTNENNITMPGVVLEEEKANEKRDSNNYPYKTKYADTTQKSANQTNDTPEWKDKKQVNKDPNILESGMEDDKIRKSFISALDEPPKNQMNKTESVLSDQIQDKQIKNVSGPDRIQKPFKDFTNTENNERNTVDDLDSKDVNKNSIIPSTVKKSLQNSTTYETKDGTEEKLNDPDSKDTPNNDVEIKYVLKNSINANTNKTMLDKQVLEKQKLKTTRSDEMTNVSKNNADADMAVTLSQDPVKEISTYYNANKLDFKGVSLKSNETDLDSINKRKQDDITAVTYFQSPNDLKKFDNQPPKGNINDDLPTSLANEFQLDDKKELLIASKADNRRSTSQSIHTSIKNLNTDSVSNLPHNLVIKASKELIKPYTDSIDSSKKISSAYNELKKQQDNSDLKKNEKTHRKVNLTDSDNIVIKNDSLHDDNKNLNINTHDRISSAILQKTPLVAKDDTGLRNDDINVIKPFKRNTFTIVASSTSLQKEQEDISAQQPNDTVNEYPKTKNDLKTVSNDQNMLNIEPFSAQNDQKRDDDFLVKAKPDTRKEDTFLKVSADDDTILEIYDQSRKNSSETQSINRVLRLEHLFAPENQISDNAEVPSNKIYQNIVTTEDHKKSTSALDVASNGVIMTGAKVQKSQESTNTKFYTTDNFFLNIKPSDLVQQISEFKDKSDHINFETSIGKAQQPNESLLNDTVLNDTYGDATGDTKTVPNAEYSVEIRPHSPLQMNTDDSFNKQILETRINSDRLNDVLTRKPIKDTKDLSNTKTLETTREWKLDTNSARNTIEYESTLLAEDKFNHELGEPRNILVDTFQSTEATKPDEKTYKLFSAEKSETGNNRNADFDSRAILHKEQSAIRVAGDGEFIKISDSDTVRTPSKVIDKEQLVTKADTGHYNQYDTVTTVDEDSDLRKISDSNTVRSFSKIIDKKPLVPRDGTIFNSEYESVSKMGEVGHLNKISDWDIMGSLHQDIHKKPLVPKDRTKHYEYTPSPKAPIFVHDSSNIDESGNITNPNAFKGDQIINERDPKILNKRPATESLNNNQNEKLLNGTDLEETISSPVNNDKPEVLLLNLAIHSYVNNNNETVVQTVNPLAEPLRYKNDTVTVVKSLIRHGNEIRIPVDVENDLSLKIISKDLKFPEDVNTSPYDSKKVFISRNLSDHAHLSAVHPEDVNKSLAFIYERELIPLHNTIKNLTEEINTLSTQQELLKDKLRSAKRTRSLRLIPVIKRCGCGRM